MRPSLLFTLILAGAGVVSAQMQNPQQGTPMGQLPGSTPRATNPMGRSGYPDIAGDQSQAQNRIDEQRFVKDALKAGMADVALAKVAVTKASDDGVKQVAQKIVDDRSKANEELKQIAAKEKIDVPESLDSKHQSRIDKLSKLSGADFDRAYVKEQMKDQQNAVKEFQMEAQNGNNPEVKSFASKTLPALEEHLRAIKELDKGKKATASK